MMRLSNGNWLTLAGNAPGPRMCEKADTDAKTRLGRGGELLLLAGIVTSGKITERWCKIMR